MDMIKVNVFEAKARLSEYLDRVEHGESILICRRNRPVAVLRAVATARTTPRPLGGLKGRFTVPASFFDPLPAEIVDAFDQGPVMYPPLAASRELASVARETPNQSGMPATSRRVRRRGGVTRQRS